MITRRPALVDNGLPQAVPFGLDYMLFVLICSTHPIKYIKIISGIYRCRPTQ